jgi:DNA repair exonuclease SbcCD ATPase subunit
LAPDSRGAVARRLLALGNDAPAYNNDPVVTLALRIAARRLLADKTGAGIPGVQDLLWQTALRLEEGGIASAEMALRQAEQALQEALDRGASDQEIERLMNRLQQAMNQFLDALSEQARKNAQNAQPGKNGQQQSLRREDLQRLLDRAREMARGGARDAARQMLSQLQEMLENLRANPYAQQQDPNARQAEEMMRDLGDLARRQQGLLDRTFRDSQQHGPGETSPNGAPFAQDQAQIHQKLQELNKRFSDLLGQSPPEFGDAGRQMGEAEGSLRAGQPGDAIDPETRALQSLQRGEQSMMQALTERFGRGPGDRPRPDQDQFGQSQDPLGRTLPGAGQVDTGDVKVPDKSDLQRAREILDELRRRAGEQQRPRYELDYLGRLLQRF